MLHGRSYYKYINLRYKNQPLKIEDYEPGFHSSIAQKQVKTVSTNDVFVNGLDVTSPSVFFTKGIMTPQPKSVGTIPNFKINLNKTVSNEIATGCAYNKCSGVSPSWPAALPRFNLLTQQYQFNIYNKTIGGITVVDYKIAFKLIFK